MASVSMAELRQRLAHYLDRVEQGERIQIKRRGKVIATMEPSLAAGETAGQRLRLLRKQARIGDVVSPLGEKWEADDAAS